MIINKIPRLNIAFTPTPLQKTERLAQKIGLTNLYIKRDDHTGLALGGNKVRKLEYLLADAKKQNADIVLTVGGPQSNHCRMTAAAARATGLECALIFGGPKIDQIQGNMVLDKLLKAEWYFSGEQDRDEKMQEIAKMYSQQGKKPYIIPLGGSNALGAMGYVRAGLELAMQCKEQNIDPNYVFCASGSGGTQAGLILGCHLGGLTSKVIGISVSGSKDELTEIINMLLVEMGATLNVDVSCLHPVTVYDEFVGQGYGRPTKLSSEAVENFASEEGIIIDPVYTAKGFAGLMGLINQNIILSEDTVVFVHTGGMPALFAETDLYWKSDIDITK